MDDKEIEKVFVDYGWHWGDDDASAYLPVARALLAKVAREASFEDSWKALGYRYSESNIEKVKLGWEMFQNYLGGQNGIA